MDDSNRDADALEGAFRAFREGRLDDAVAAFESHLDRHPDDVEALHALAMAHLRSERPDDALRVARRIVEIEPDEPLSHATLSLFLMRTGRREEAEAESARARVLQWKRELDDGAAEAPPQAGPSEDR